MSTTKSDPEPTTVEEIEQLSATKLVENAKKTGESTAIWQHPLTDNAKSCFEGLSCTCISVPTARKGDQTMVVIPE